MSYKILKDINKQLGAKITKKPAIYKRQTGF